MTTTYLIQASPFSKLFMRQYQHECAEDPDFFKPYFDGKGKPFEVMIPRSQGAILFTHMKPIHINKVMPKKIVEKSKDGLNFSPDQESIIYWLTGAASDYQGPKEDLRSEETDIYGVVQLPVDLDVGAALVDVAGIAESGSDESMKKATKTVKDIQAELVQRTKKGIELAREHADWRVKRAMKITHLNLMKQYEVLKQDGKGVYAPSVAEAVGAHILAAELEHGEAATRKMQQRLAEVMKNASILNQ